MVNGIDKFKEYFRDFPDQYSFIGGVACDLLMSSAGLDFRATKDLDVVLIIEALTAEFVQRFWKFVKDAGYELKEKSNGEHIDSRHIKKHKNDVFRLSMLLTGNENVKVGQSIHNDFKNFIEYMQSDTVDLKSLGISELGKDDILNMLTKIYNV